MEYTINPVVVKKASVTVTLTAEQVSLIRAVLGVVPYCVKVDGDTASYVTGSLFDLFVNMETELDPSVSFRIVGPTTTVPVQGSKNG